VKAFVPERAWVEINLDNIAHNYASFKRLTKTRVMCVIKADGYGHGSVALAQRLEKEGCDAFGVATLDEGLELRRAGIHSFILLFNHVSAHRLVEAINANLTMTIYSLDMAKEIFTAARICNKIVNVHVKIDTGMTRIGFNPDRALLGLQYAHKLPNLKIEGVYTHFSSADETDFAYTDAQIAKFQKVCEQAEAAGIHIPIKHAAGSAAAMQHPKARLDMVRIGISLYGCYPSREVIVPKGFELKPAMQFKTQIYRINEVDEGVAVSYGRRFVTARKTKLATIPIGYADGLSRVMMGKLTVLINGQVAHVVGRICMDQCIVDITDVEGEVKILDEVVVFGGQNGAFLPVEATADAMGTINYEILCMVARRIPRIYFEDGQIAEVKNYLIEEELF